MSAPATAQLPAPIRRRIFEAAREKGRIGSEPEADGILSGARAFGQQVIGEVSSSRSPLGRQTDSATRLLGILRTLHSTRGRHWWRLGHKWLGKKIGKGRSTVIRALKDLEVDALVERADPVYIAEHDEKRGGVTWKAGSAPNDRDVYRLGAAALALFGLLSEAKGKGPRPTPAAVVPGTISPTMLANGAELPAIAPASADVAGDVARAKRADDRIWLVFVKSKGTRPKRAVDSAGQQIPALTLGDAEQRAARLRLEGKPALVMATQAETERQRKAREAAYEAQKAKLAQAVHDGLERAFDQAAELAAAEAPAAVGTGAANSCVKIDPHSPRSVSSYLRDCSSDETGAPPGWVPPPGELVDGGVPVPSQHAAAPAFAGAGGLAPRPDGRDIRASAAPATPAPLRALEPEVHPDKPDPRATSPGARDAGSAPSGAPEDHAGPEPECFEWGGATAGAKAGPEVPCGALEPPSPAPSPASHPATGRAPRSALGLAGGDPRDGTPPRARGTPLAPPREVEVDQNARAGQVRSADLRRALLELEGGALVDPVLRDRWRREIGAPAEPPATRGLEPATSAGARPTSPTLPRGSDNGPGDGSA